MAKKIILNEIPDDRGMSGQRRARDAERQTPDAGRPVVDLLMEIRRLYFKTTAQTIERDFDRAIDLLKTIPLPEDRQRATVYMEGLAEMRKEWKGRRRGNRQLPKLPKLP
jgi:hypothetical protein